MIERGDIRWFRFAHPDKRRPVLVVALSEVLPSLAQVPVIPLSTQGRGLPWEVEMGVEDGLPGPSFLKPEWIRSVDRTLLGPRLATLPDTRWTEVRRAVLHILGFQP